MLITGAVAALLVVRSALTPAHGPPTEQQPNAASQQSCESKPFWERTKCDPIAFWTLCLVGFTAVLAGVSIAQARVLIRTDRTARAAANAATVAATATKDSVAQMKDTAQRQLRAYVGHSGVSFDNQPAPDSGMIKVVIALKNSGATPAYGVICRTKVDLLPIIPFFAKDFDFRLPPVNARAVGTLGPNQEYRHHAWANRSFTAAELAKLEYGFRPIEQRVNVYVYGTITYLDSFGRSHFTNFCYWINRGGGPVEHIWGVTIFHNHAD